MVIFTKAWLSGLGRDQSNTWDNIFLNWIESNWTLTSPPKYNAVTAPFGVLFGEDYNGQWDFVAYSSIKDEDGVVNENTTIGGRMSKEVVYITFCFTVRKYSVRTGDEIPIEVGNVIEFVEDLIDKNPRALRNEGILLMEFMNYNDGEYEIAGQQIYEIDFRIKCLVSRINLE